MFGYYMYIFTYTDGSRERMVFVVICLSVFRTISKKPLQLGSPNLTYKCSTMIHGNPFILRSKGQRLRSRVTKTDGVGLCTLASAGFF